MNIYYNNIEKDNLPSILTFTEIPNILKVEEDINGTKATLTFTFNDGLRSTVTADSQYYVTFLGETVSNVMEPDKAKNKRFYISGDASGTAMSFARALRNCSGIAADFYIVNNNAQVFVTAKTIGQKWSSTPNYLQRNIPTQYMGVSAQDGNAYSVLFNSKIGIDVYEGSTTDLQNYVTTLEKNYYGNNCSFDVSPILSTFSEYGKTKPYTFDIQLIREDGEWQNLGSITGSSSIGYHANQSLKYMTANGVQMLLNKNRGLNDTMILYTYYNTIPYSTLCGLDTGGWSVVVSAKDSAFNEIWNSGVITNRRTSSNMIVESTATVPQTAFTSAYYVDVTVGTQTTRFNVIKPLKATEYAQRIQWRNEYGGVSFFDFTGARSESDNVDIETYEKNIFDYHDYTSASGDTFELKKIYSNDYKKSVTLTSHLMEADGRWIFNSLMRSKKVWTEVNGKLYYIIPTSISVQEDQTYNNIYTAKLTYEYSDI